MIIQDNYYPRIINPFLTFESVTTLNREFIESEKNTLAKREIYDEIEVNEINFFER